MKVPKTHCEWSPEYTPADTRYYQGKRRRRVCANESSKEAWAAKRELAELREALATVGRTVNSPSPDLVKEWYAKAKSEQDQETKRKTAQRRVEKRKAAARRRANHESP